MASLEVLNADVQRGINVLDARGPRNWYGQIDLDRLNIESSDDCILGQLFGSYLEGNDATGINGGAFNHGFAGKDHQSIWEQRILERRARETQPISVPERVLVGV